MKKKLSGTHSQISQFLNNFLYHTKLYFLFLLLWYYPNYILNWRFDRKHLTKMCLDTFFFKFCFSNAGPPLLPKNKMNISFEIVWKITKKAMHSFFFKMEKLQSFFSWLIIFPYLNETRFRINSSVLCFKYLSILIFWNTLVGSIIMLADASFFHCSDVVARIACI